MQAASVSFGSRAKPLIVTRLSHVIVAHHSSAVGISSARHLAQTPAVAGSASATALPQSQSSAFASASPSGGLTPMVTTVPSSSSSPVSKTCSHSQQQPQQPQQPQPQQQPSPLTSTSTPTTTTTTSNATVTAAATDHPNKEDVTTNAAAGGATAVEGGSGAKTNNSNSNSNNSSNHSESFSRASTWLWRTIYLTAGVSAAGVAAKCAYDSSPVRQAAQSVYDNVDARLRPFTTPSRDKLLPDAVSPYASVAPPRTLVLELENTLVHSTYSRATGWRVAKRPGAEAFLAYLASMYEIVLFTSNIPSYADPILSRLDPHGYVTHRLYRSETRFLRGVHMKDLTPLNRPLNRVVVLDCNEKAVELQPDNAIVVPEWSGDPADTVLLDLIPLLEGVVREDVADVRPVLRDVKGKVMADAVAEYRALAAARAQRARPASVFGHLAEPSAAERSAPDASDDADAGAGGGADDAKSRAGLWGSLPGRSKLFNYSRPSVGNVGNQ